jgi:hypothetical protein
LDHPEGLERCECGFHGKADIEAQDHSDWQCAGCRASHFRVQKMTAGRNLEEREAEGRVLPIDPSKRKGPLDCLKRWINVTWNNRNYCPGCHRDYRHVENSYYDRIRGDYRPSSQWLKQCMVCLGRRP